MCGSITEFSICSSINSFEVTVESQTSHMLSNSMAKNCKLCSRLTTLDVFLFLFVYLEVWGSFQCLVYLIVFPSFIFVWSWIKFCVHEKMTWEGIVIFFVYSESWVRKIRTLFLNYILPHTIFHYSLKTLLITFPL